MFPIAGDGRHMAHTSVRQEFEVDHLVFLDRNMHPEQSGGLCPADRGLLISHPYVLCLPSPKLLLCAPPEVA